MEVLGWTLLFMGSIALGIAVPLIRDVPDPPHRWILTSVAAFIGAFVGAFVASEWLFETTEPVWAGVALWPALIGGLVLAILVDALTVSLLEGSRTGTQGPETTVV